MVSFNNTDNAIANLGLFLITGTD